MSSPLLSKRDFLKLSTSAYLFAPSIVRSQQINRYGLRVAGIYSSSRPSVLQQIIHQDTVKVALTGEIQYDFFNSIPPEEFEEILRMVSENEYDLIIANSEEQPSTFVQTLPDFPNSTFLLKGKAFPYENHPRTAIFEPYNHEVAYLSGIISSGLSETKAIGFLGSIFSPKANRNINAFIQGSKEIEPNIKLLIDFIGDEENPDEITQKIDSQINAGVDIIYAERVGTEQFVVEREIPFIGNLVDHYGDHSDWQITSTLWHFSPILYKALRKIKNSDFQKASFDEYSSLSFGGCSLASLREHISKIPEQTMERLNRRLIEISRNTFKIANIEVTPTSGT